jgi:hypothetical protein
VTLSTKNDLEGSDHAPLIGTPNWGGHSASYWSVHGWISTGTASYTSSGISLTAPQAEGTYYIVFAFNAEFEADQVASCTNWRYESKYGRVLWDDGNDVAELSNNQLAEAQANGRTTVQYQFQSWKQSWSLPADAVKVVVSTTPTPEPDPLPTDQTGVLAGTVVDTSGSPVPGVTVELDNGDITATRTNGTFAFSLTAGVYMVTLTKDGYEGRQVQVTVNNGSTNQIGEISLSLEGEDPDPSLPAWLPIAFILAAAAAIIAILVMRRVR